jgi:Protein of unknown function (DUF2917)
MNAATVATTVALAHQAVMRINDPAGLEITATSGMIWLTLDSDLRDVILTAGTAENSFITTEHRIATLYALADSQVSVAAHNTQAVATQLAPVQARCSGNALLPWVHA